MNNDTRLGLAPMGAMPMPILFWAGMFTAMMTACVGLMAVTYRR